MARMPKIFVGDREVVVRVRKQLRLGQPAMEGDLGWGITPEAAALIRKKGYADENCEHCFGTGLMGGFQSPCPAGCPRDT